MTSRGAVAAKVRKDREEHPERYCTQCLWRIQGPRATPCPRHPLAEKAEPPATQSENETHV